MKKCALLLLSLAFVAAPAAAADGAPPVQHKVVRDFCLATQRQGEEGAPNFWYQVDCKTGKTEYTKGKWCWTLRKACFDEVDNQLVTLMKSKGYETARTFNGRSDRPYEWVFRRPGTPDKDLCLVSRSASHGGVLDRGSFTVQYRVDCRDGVMATLDGLEKTFESTDGIRAFMTAKGYSYVDSFEYRRGTGLTTLVFERD